MIRLAANSDKFERAVSRLLRALQTLHHPIGPGEVRCGLQHAYGHEDTSKPVFAVSRRGKGCPGCGARL